MRRYWAQNLVLLSTLSYSEFHKLNEYKINLNYLPIPSDRIATKIEVSIMNCSQSSNEHRHD